MYEVGRLIDLIQANLVLVRAYFIGQRFFYVSNKHAVKIYWTEFLNLFENSTNEQVI